MPLNPSEKKFFDFLTQMQQESPSKPLAETGLEEWRRDGASFFSNPDFTGEAAKVAFQDSSVAVRDGYRVPIRVYHSDLKQATPVLIYYPGCGYLIDLFEVNAIAASRIAYHAGIKVIVVNHRIGPEHPMPGSMLDAYDVTRYIATHTSEFGIDPKRIFIGGISSGGNCAAVISSLARKDKSFSVYHQILVNGWLDLKRRFKGFEDYEAEETMLTKEVIDFLIAQHRLTPEMLNDPLMNPTAEEDFVGLPKTTIIVGEYDGIRADSELYYECLVEAGNDVEKIVLPGQTHNTLVLRKVKHDGRDPAEVVAEIIRKNS